MSSRARRLATVGACAALMGLAPSGQANAQTKAAPPPPSAESTTTQWYGWQIIPLDLLAIGLTTAGLAKSELRVVIPGGALFLAGAPSVHLAHRQFTTTLQSFAVRAGGAVVGTGLGVLGGLLVLAATGCNDGGGCLWRNAGWGGAIGLGVAAIAASTLDILVFADEPDEARSETRMTTLAPSMQLDVNGHPTFGLAGRF